MFVRFQVAHSIFSLIPFLDRMYLPTRYTRTGRGAVQNQKSGISRKQDPRGCAQNAIWLGADFKEAPPKIAEDPTASTWDGQMLLLC